MRDFVRVVGLLVLMSSPAWAKTHPNDMEAFSNRFVKTQMNFNKKTSDAPRDSAYPTGKNAYQPPAHRAIATSKKPKKPICVGNDCGCSSKGN